MVRTPGIARRSSPRFVNHLKVRCYLAPKKDGPDGMRYEVSGTTMQTVGIDLSPGETIYSQTATMAWMTDGVRMNPHPGGGLLAGLQRSLTGGSFFITEFSADRGGHIAFAPRFPG